jgi:hypothetical protein
MHQFIQFSGGQLAVLSAVRLILDEDDPYDCQHLTHGDDPSLVVPFSCGYSLIEGFEFGVVLAGCLSGLV